jgi:predicted transcriptional regulator
MKRRTPAVPRPTDSELAILRVLWDRGARTVRQIHEEFSRTRPSGYTTVLKTLQIMTDKGLVKRDEANRTHVYEAAQTEQQTQRRLVGDLLERAFGGSAAKLVMQALGSRKTPPEDLARIRRFLDDLEEGRR